MSGTYKPTEHGGLKEDGTQDKRVGTGEFAHGKVDPHEAGAQGGKTSGRGDNDADEVDEAGEDGGDQYKPTEHGGKKKDGGQDGRVKQ